MTIRVVVADDHPLIRAGISAMLNAHADIDIVAQVATASEAVEAAAALLPDIVVLEARMPSGDCLDAIATIVGEPRAGRGERRIQVLAVTQHHTVPIVCETLRAGASGFLLKSAPPQILAGAVRAVAAAGAWLDGTVLADLLGELLSQPASCAELLVRRNDLTPRERDILVHMAAGLSNSGIASRLFISTATVRTHVGRVLMKLNCRNRSQAVAAAYRTGLVHVHPLPGSGDGCPDRAEPSMVAPGGPPRCR